ncbi:Krueppel factor [Apis cerana cerana]|uniref:Krueppel factor n=1 Tax=Apis cerana cerana TaxID=94128 RepID=A0A2A3E2G4_APICC|nr:Krueppel factor [Apis cerana cerana]
MKNLRELASRRYRAVLPRREAVAGCDSVSPAASTRSHRVLLFVYLLVGLIWFEKISSLFCAETSYERIAGVTMDILPSGNIFRELQDIHDTGYFSAQPSLEDHWQQTISHLKLYRNK